MKTMNAANFETRSVLAGAYKGSSAERALLTHLVHFDGVDSMGAATCRKSLNIVDHYDGNAETRAARPTCPACAARWGRLHG